MKYYTVISDDCNLAHTEINIRITSLCSVVLAHRFTKEFLSPLPQTVQNFDVGSELELAISLPPPTPPPPLIDILQHQ